MRMPVPVIVVVVVSVIVIARVFVPLVTLLIGTERVAQMPVRSAMMMLVAPRAMPMRERAVHTRQRTFATSVRPPMNDIHCPTRERYSERRPPDMGVA